MGNIFSIFGSGDNIPDVILDLECTTSKPDEVDIYKYASEILRPTEAVLKSLKQYSGCGELIRKAISTPNRQNEEEAWNALCPSVAKLKDYYEFAQKIEEAFPQLLKKLCSGNVEENLKNYQSVAKCLGDMLFFVSQWDDLKMTNPAIQNDFSYYRRTLTRNKGNQNEEIPVQDELANKMSLFYAYSTPMLKIIIDSAMQCINNDPDVTLQQVTLCLAILSLSHYNSIIKNRAQTAQLKSYCLRVMTICIILYDHIEPHGVFVKASKVNIRGYIKLIQNSGGTDTETLLNALRYTSKHLNDETTPKNIKTILTG